MPRDSTRRCLHVTVTVGDITTTVDINFDWDVDPAPSGILIEDGVVTGVSDTCRPSP
jgi:hypothetical protein